MRGTQSHSNNFFGVKCTHSFCKLDRFTIVDYFSIALKWSSFLEELVNILQNLLIGSALGLSLFDYFLPSLNQYQHKRL